MTGTPALSGLPFFLLFFFIATPVGTAIYMLWLAWTRGGEVQTDAVSVQYEAPCNLTPAECGALVDDGVALRAITATVTDLSVKGYLKIEMKENGESAGAHADFVFHLTKPLTEWDNLKLHERKVLGSIFIPTNPLLLLSQSLEHLANAEKAAGNEALSSFTSRAESKAKEASDQYQAISGFSNAVRNSVPMSNVQGHFALHLTEIRDAILDGLVGHGYYASRPDRIRKNYWVSGVSLGLLMAFVGAVLASMAGMAPLLFVLIGLLTGAMLLGFGVFLPARTRVGAQTLARILGFREFLGRVEKDHIERLEKTSELFEKYLPYAMALGVENRWTQTFADITITPPQWYQGKRRDGFLPMHLTDDLNEMSSPPRTMPG